MHISYTFVFYEMKKTPAARKRSEITLVWEQSLAMK